MNVKRSDINYFKIGTFVLVGIGLVVFMVLIFGINKMFQPTVYVETYFNESIQGVDVGSPVKYRGLQVGYVKEIAFTREIYDQDEILPDSAHVHSIYVKIAVTSELFTKFTSKELKKFLADEIAHGLCVRLVVQGLTGTSYLEFDYIDPQNIPQHKFLWRPKYFYVPTVTSSLTQLSENIQRVFSDLKDVDFKTLFSDLNVLVNSLDRTTNKVDELLDKLNEPLVKSIYDWRIITRDLRMFSHRIKLKPSEIVFSSYPQPLEPKAL